MTQPFRRLLLILALLTTVLWIGTLGFHLVEGWDWFDSFLHGVDHADHGRVRGNSIP